MKDKPHIRTVIAGNVKRYRKLRKLTQENLAELADVSNTFFKNLLTNDYAGAIILPC